MSSPSPRTLIAGLILISLGFGGCRYEEASNDTAGTPAVASTVSGTEGTPAITPMTRDWTSEVQLVPVTFDQWQNELASMRGRIVVVDQWATWCAPCIERFPAMLEMAKRWEPQGVRFVSLSLDDRDDPDSAPHAREFLTKHNARIPNYMMDEIIPDAFEKLGILGIPAVFVYDAKGALRYRLTGDDPNHQFTDADVEKAVRTLTEEALGKE